MNFTQKINEKDFKKALYLHYFSFKYTWINPILGVLMILIAVCLSIVYKLFDTNILIVILLGLFLTIRPWWYVRQVLNSGRTDKTCSTEFEVEITDDDKIVTRQGEDYSSICLSNLYAWYDKSPFLFLYSARNQYLVLDKRQMTDDQVHDLTERLDQMHVRKR